MEDIKYKFNIENLSVQGSVNGKKVFERVYEEGTYIFDKDGNIVDTLVYTNDETVREGIKRTDAFFDKHGIDQEVVSGLFRANKEYLPERNLPKSNVIKIMRFHKKEA